MSKLKPNDIVMVKWFDQSYYTGPVEQSKAMQECYGETVGYFLEQTKEWLCLGMEQFTTDRVSYRHIVSFPICAVSKVIKIKSAKPPPEPRV